MLPAFPRLTAVVNLPTVSGVHDIDRQSPVVNGVDYPVVADAETEQTFIVFPL